MDTKILAFLFLGVVAVLVYPKEVDATPEFSATPEYYFTPVCSDLRKFCANEYEDEGAYGYCMSQPCDEVRDDLDFEDREIPDDSSFDTLDGDRNPDGKSG